MRSLCDTVRCGSAVPRQVIDKLVKITEIPLKYSQLEKKMQQLNSLKSAFAETNHTDTKMSEPIAKNLQQVASHV